MKFFMLMYNILLACLNICFQFWECTVFINYVISICLFHGNGSTLAFYVLKKTCVNRQRLTKAAAKFNQSLRNISCCTLALLANLDIQCPSLFSFPSLTIEQKVFIPYYEAKFRYRTFSFFHLQCLYLVANSRKFL